MSIFLRRVLAPGPTSWALLVAVSVVACASSVGEAPIAAGAHGPAAPAEPSQRRVEAGDEGPVAATGTNEATPAESSEARSDEGDGSDPQVHIVLREGDTAIGADGLPVAGVGLAVTDGMGRLAFTGRLDDNGSADSFVWRDGSIIWRASEVEGSAPGGLSPLMGSGNAGGYVFQTMVNGLDALWSHQGLLLLKKQVAPGIGDGSEILLSRWPTMTADGTAYWVSDFSDGPGVRGKGRALYRSPGATPDAIELVLRSDQPIDGFPIARPWGIDFNYQVSDNGEHLIQVLVLDTGSESDNSALYVDGHIALREGDAIDENEVWERFSRVAINDRGDYLAVAETDAHSMKDKVIAYNGSIVLREEDKLDTVHLPAQAQALSVALDNDGRAAHLWSVGGFGSEYLFFACDGARLKDSVLLFKSNQTFAVEDGTRFGVKRFSDVGHGPALWLGPGDRLYAEANLYVVGLSADEIPPEDAGDFEAIISLPLPGCPQVDGAGG